MAKRSVIEWDNSGVESEEEVQVPVTVSLVLKKAVKLTTIGKVTGNRYVFDGAGSVVEVDERDAPYLLEKRPSGACCSGTVPDRYFDKVG